MGLFSFLDREHTIAKPGFNRWLVPPAALSIHLAIGQAYAFSVFNLPLTKILGITTSTPDDWKLTTIGWIFSIAIVFLGLSAAFLGAWLERVGPRKAMFLSAVCFFWWIHGCIFRCKPSPNVVDLFRLRCSWRYRSWCRLYFTC